MDVLDGCHQIIGRIHIDTLLDGRAQLRGIPELFMQVRGLFQMLRLEVVGPEDEQLFLGQVRLLFLNADEARIGIVIGRLCRAARSIIFLVIDSAASAAMLAGGRVVDAAGRHSGR